MSRLGYLARHPKRTLSALGTLLLAAGLTVGSGAYFTDTESSTLNSASAATFDLQMAGSSDPALDASTCHTGVDPDCSVTTLGDFTDTSKTTFQISKLVPSDSRTYTRHFALKNNGNVPMVYRVKGLAGAGSNSDLLDALDVTVVRGSDALLTDGRLDAFNETEEIAAGATHEFAVTFKLPDSESDQTAALAGKALTATIKAVANDVNEGTPGEFSS